MAGSCRWLTSTSRAQPHAMAARYLRPDIGARFTDWHTYTIEWSPGRVRYLLDDVVVLDSTEWVPTTPMRWQLQTETRGDGNNQWTTARRLGLRLVLQRIAKEWRLRWTTTAIHQVSGDHLRIHRGALGPILMRSVTQRPHDTAHRRRRVDRRHRPQRLRCWLASATGNRRRRATVVTDSRRVPKIRGLSGARNSGIRLCHW